MSEKKDGLSDELNAFMSAGASEEKDEKVEEKIEDAEEKVEDKVEEVEETEEKDETEEKVDELTPREKAMLARIEKLTGKTLDIDDAVKDEEPEAKPKPKPKVEPEPEKDPDFIGADNLDEILDDPKKLNALLVKVYKMGVDTASGKASEKVLTSIPRLVTQYVGKHATMSNLVSDFYKKNADLAGVKKTVAAVANDVASENPGLSVDQVFEKVAERTREVLGMKAKAKTPALKKSTGDKPDTKKPAFADQHSRKATPSSGLKGLAKEVNDLLS